MAVRSHAFMPSERGIALVTVLLVVAIAATLSAEVLWRQLVLTRQTENQRHAAQVRAIVQGAIDWVGLILEEDRAQGPADHSGERWATPVIVPVEYGEVNGRLSDAQACFNLNNLVNNGQPSPADIEAYRRLLTLLNLSSELADALLDWMDADAQLSGPAGAEDGWYLAQEPPRHAANQPIAEVSELSQVRGYDAQTVRRLVPYVCALPEQTPVNVNSAPAEVLMAYLPGLDAASTARLLQARGCGFESLDQLRALLPAHQQHPASSQRLSVSSQYFELELGLQFGDVTQRFRALLYRPMNGPVRPVWLRRIA